MEPDDLGEMRQTHGPGEKPFVDFAGDKVPVFGARGRRAAVAHIFVACWSIRRPAPHLRGPIESFGRELDAKEASPDNFSL